MTTSTATPADFPTWAAHYGYDQSSPEAREDYAEYVAQGQRMAAMFGRG